MSCNQFVFVKKYTNSFVIDRISFVHTNTIIQKGGNSFMWNLCSPVFYGSETRSTLLIVQSMPSVLHISYIFFSVCVLETQIHVLGFITVWICQVCNVSLTKLLLLAYYWDKIKLVHS